MTDMDNSTADKIDSCRNPYVRDLAWILASPPLITLSSGIDNLPVDTDWLTQLDSNPEHLMAHLADKNLRMLGPYFEALWAYYLKYHPGNQLLQQNLQVFEGDKTLGEFDFIYRHPLSGHYFHLEVAVKYYLGVPGGSQAALDPSESTSLEQWIGPGTRDRLDLKVNRLIEHQSRLSSHPAGKAVLQRHGILHASPQISLLGYLFYPCGQDFGPPESANERHNKGIWVHYAQLAQFLNGENWWGILDKPHWLAPVLRKKDELLTGQQLHENVRRHFATDKRPLLISAFSQVSGAIQPQASQTVYQSSELVFIVPNGWPGKR